MNTKNLELRADRRLLKSNFDGYKLSLDPVPVIREQLQNIPDQVHPSKDQYSYLHAELFSLHNHLIHDPWTNDTVYYIDTTWTTRRVQYNLQEGRFKPTTSVFRMTRAQERLPGHYNLSLVFISEKYAVIGDGVASIEIVDTGDRTKGQEWKQLAHVRIFPEERNGFLLRDARLEIHEESKYIHCLLVRIEQGEGGFESVLEWIAINLSDKSISYRRELRSKSSICYAALTSNLSGVVVSSASEVKFTFDSKNPIVEEDTSSDVAAVQYSWRQTSEMIVITFHERKLAQKSDFEVKCSAEEICVKFRNEILLQGDIFGQINVDLTTWNLLNESFQLILFKTTEGESWPFFLTDGPPEDTADKSETIIDESASNRSTSLASEMEECDHGNGDAEYFVARIDATSHTMTHKAYLGSCPPLFSIPLRPGQPSALALRYDVDCCLWIPCQMSNEWILHHEGTLDAFAYILASKQQRKYASCCPDLSYSVICEPERHIFIYKAKYESATGLRKRSGSQVALGQQKVVLLENADDQVIGMSVQNEVTFLLTKKFLLCLQINTEQ